MQRCEEQGIDLPEDLCERMEKLNKKKGVSKVEGFDDLKDGKKGRRTGLTRYQPAAN